MGEGRDAVRARPLMEPFLSGAREQIDVYLGAVLPPASEPPVRLHAAMRYAVFGGGKRLRPALAFAAARACEAEPERVLPVAGAAELIHAYSLVHDDLPAMDDDVERRGRPTVHVRYSEATAILVGDALPACAVGLLAGAGVEAELIAMLAHAAGSEGLVGGQEDDLGFRSEPVTLERVTSIHRRKTAALFGFSVLGAARLVGAPDERLRVLGTFAEEYGRAFQLLDDLGEARDTEKPEECSVLRVISPEAAVERARGHLDRALEALSPLGAPGRWLAGLADHLSGRLP